MQFLVLQDVIDPVQNAASNLYELRSLFIGTHMKSGLP